MSIFDIISKPLDITLGNKPAPLPTYKSLEPKPLNSSLFESIKQPISSIVNAPAPVSTTLPPQQRIVRNQTFQDVKELPSVVAKAVKEFALPNRGYTDEEIAGAKPTFKEKLTALPKVAAEISGGIGSLVGGSKLFQAIADTKVGSVLADLGKRQEEFAVPKTAGDAKAMRVVDAGTFFLGELKAGSAASALSKTKNVTKIADILEAEVKNLSRAEAEKIAPALVNVTDQGEAQRALNQINFKKNGVTLPDNKPAVIPAEYPAGSLSADEIKDARFNYGATLNKKTSGWSIPPENVDEFNKYLAGARDTTGTVPKAVTPTVKTNNVLTDAIDKVSTRFEGNNFAREKLSVLRGKVEQMTPQEFIAGMQDVISSIEGDRFAQEGLQGIIEKVRQSIPKEIPSATVPKINAPTPGYDDALTTEAFVARTFDEFARPARSMFPNMTDAELKTVYAATDQWKSNPVLRALAEYKLSVSGGSSVDAGKELFASIAKDPEMSKKIAEASKTQIKVGDTLYRYGNVNGNSWTTEPDPYFENGRPLQTIKVTPEILNRVIYAEGAETKLGYTQFPNTGEGEVILNSPTLPENKPTESVTVPKRAQSIKDDIIKEDFTDIQGIDKSKIKKVELFGSSVEGKANPGDIDVFVTVADDAAKFKIKNGIATPITFERGKFSYIVMPESDASNLLDAMLYTGRKDPDRGYSGTAVNLPKKLWGASARPQEVKLPPNNGALKTTPALERLRQAGEAMTKETSRATLAGEREDLRMNTPKMIDQVDVFPEGTTSESVVPVYRASTGEIKAGEYITTDLANAEKYQKLRPGSVVNTTQVKVGDLVKGEGLNSEFIYAPKAIGEMPRSSNTPLDKDQGEISNQIQGGPKTELPPSQVASKLDSYKSSYNESPEKAIEATARDTGDTPGMVKRTLGNLKDIKTNLIEYVQDRSERVRLLVKQSKEAGKLSEESDPFLAMTLYDGRVGAKIEAAKKEVGDIIGDMNKVAKTNKTDIATVRKEVSDYLVARHAPERNAALGEKAAGQDTQTALAKKAKVEAESPEIVKIADRVQTLHNQTLDMLHDSQVITPELYDTLRKTYKNHVPLQRIFPEGEGSSPMLGAKGYDVKSTGIKRATGSSKEVEEVLSNIITGYQEAVLRSEKNLVDLSTLKFAQKNGKEVSDLLEITKPKVVGTDFAGKPIMEKTQDPNVLQMFDKGKKVWIKIKDPKLAVALRGVGKEKLGSLLNVLAQFTRLYSGLQTRFNPEFALPNKIRDLQETLLYLASEGDVGFKGAARTAVKDPQSTKDVVDHIRGKQTAGARLYAEMKAQGGTTGGFGLSTKQQVEVDLAKLEKLATSKTAKIANNVVEYVDVWNTIFEDSTRLSVYKQALESGLSKKRAAFLAKEASINFNRMGKGGPVINALWMFSNASIQGSAKMLRALKNPKVLGAVVLAVGGAVAATNEWNDQADPEWREKVSKYDRLNGLTVVLPSTDDKFRYFTIPVSWGIKPIKVMADYSYDSLAGKGFDAKNAVNDTVGALANAYNPVGGTDFLSAAVPTFLDTPVEIGRNKSWSGSRIRPDFDKNAPADIQYFSSLGDTKTGQAAISISEILHDKAGIAVSPADIKYAYDAYVGGAGRAVSKTVNLISGGLPGQTMPPVAEFPIVSRFYRERKLDEISSNTGGKNDAIKNTLEDQSRARFVQKNTATDFVDSLKGMPKAEIATKLADIAKKDPALFAKIKDIAVEKAKGLTSTDKLVSQLGVANGERAAYIITETKKLNTKEQKAAFLKDLADKKLLTKEVIAQMAKALNQK